MDLFKKLHQTIMDLYVEEMEKDPKRISFELRQKVLALYIELTNNIQLLH